MYLNKHVSAEFYTVSGRSGLVWAVLSFNKANNKALTKLGLLGGAVLPAVQTARHSLTFMISTVIF